MTTLTETQLPNLRHRGKVRDTYRLNGKLLLMVATDRISAFDVVLPNGIPGKGIILSRLSAFWFKQTAHLIPNHFIAMGQDSQSQGVRIPAGVSPEVLKRAMVVREGQRINIECVVRGYLSGSAWAEYQEKGTIGGMSAPKGLKESDKLPEPLFTPTTKAEQGHDLNMSFQQVVEMVGAKRAEQIKEESLKVYQFAEEYARQKGIIIADTKFEFGTIDGTLSLIDELLTPDSSRFWELSRYKPGQPQPSYDKQFVRDWLTRSGWNREPPAPQLPPDIVSKTAEKYTEAYRRLTGQEPPR